MKETIDTDQGFHSKSCIEELVGFVSNKLMTYKALFFFFLLCSLCAENPIIKHIYTADPSARVFGDVLYLYPSHDRDEAKWWDMEDWHVFSTTDLVTYEDHGKALSLDDISWANQYAWAPDCVEHNGNYYFYFPTDQRNIGVAVSKSPTGPFKDVLGQPLVTKDTPGIVSNRDFIDPTVFIDDDGTPYMFVGQNTVNAFKLGDDMMSIDGDIHIIEGATHFFEAAWVHKYKDKYYLSYSGDHRILYAIADKPLGPYEFKGEILGPVNSGTNHHSIVEYKGEWYLFYHTSDLALQNIEKESEDYRYIRWRRSCCMDKLYYNEDGTIQKVIPTNANFSVE